MEPGPRATRPALQLGAIGAITGIDVAPLADTLALVDPLLARPLEISWRGDGAALSVSAPVETADRALLVQLDAALSPGRAPLATAAASVGGACQLELRTGVPVGGCLRWIGARTVRDDRALLDALGIAREARDTIVDLLGFVPERRGAIAVHSSGDVELGRIGTPTAEVLASLAGAAQVTTPQRALLAQVHPLLAREHAVLVSLAVTPTALAPRLVLRYAAMPWDLALRFVSGLYRGDSAARLGTFAGAVGAEHVASLELVLGPSEPPVAWIAAAQA